MKNRNIVLIGFMGSGKTSVGLRLSYRLRLPVEDTDKLIERREGCSISEMFAEKGEEYFRRKETELLGQLAERSYGSIYSVGGGTPVRPENRALLRRLGKVVLLRIQPETVYTRLRGDTSRPLLQCDNPREKIRELLESRREAYEDCADVIIDVDDKEIDEILEEIVKETGKMKILVINGPNLNFLGIREKSVYGTQDYQYLLDMIQRKAEETGNEITVFQSNHEGAIIDRIQEAYFDGTEGIVINPGAYTHYSYAIRDALASITVPKVEIHISDITKREEFRKVSVTAPVCDRQIYGQGLEGYLQAIDFILNG
ncbi:MAG: type II 3-dehydroquinate dehydratase [Lachnospiraceae bacterium]|nr:type II 3-dehydroquinate dehydratase [Lachnospiraceae bacterium]